MRKYSREHGWMILSAYAAGDGPIRFAWVSDGDPNGAVLGEHITESDVSEFLRQDGGRWKNWEILSLQPDMSKFPDIRLVEPVHRPFHTSKRLVFRGEEYRYSYTGDKENPGSGDYFPSSVRVYAICEDREDDHEHPVENMCIVLALCFFLNHEEDFERQGLTTRKKDAGSERRAVYDVGVSAQEDYHPDKDGRQ